MAQVIRRNFRRDYRREAPNLVVKVGGDVVHTKDWSLGGFSIYDMHRLSNAYGPKDAVFGALSLSERGPEYEFCAVVTRVAPETNVVALRFTELSSECFSFLESLLRRPSDQ